MMKAFSKSLLTFLMLLFFSITLPAAAVTQDELRAQISALTNQVVQLQSQLQAKQAQVVQSPVASCQAFTQLLRKGSSGGEVTLLQTYLAKDKALYPEGLVTGYFGELTGKAVQRFQIKYGIVSSGTPDTTGFGQVGPKTRMKLNEVYGCSGPNSSGSGVTLFERRSFWGPCPPAEQPCKQNVALQTDGLLRFSGNVNTSYIISGTDVARVDNLIKETGILDKKCESGSISGYGMIYMIFSGGREKGIVFPGCKNETDRIDKLINDIVGL